MERIGNLKNEYVEGGELCWLHFITESGHSSGQSGDYAYQQCYAPNRSQKIEDGETYVKVRITSVVSKYGRLTFNLVTVNKDDTESYATQCNDIERLTIIK